MTAAVEIAPLLTHKGTMRDHVLWTGRGMRIMCLISLFPFTVTNAASQLSAYNLNCELDYFQLFCTDKLMDNIVCETNRCARENISSAGKLPKESI